MKKIVAPKELPKPVGYSQAVRVGNFLFISGQISEDSKGEIIGKGNFEKQARQVFENLRATVNAEGGSLEDIVKITVHLTDMNNLAKFREIRSEYFKRDYPASTLIEVKNLISKKLLIEVDAIAALH
ncbi:2-iminobutanoate/2-iminopropanoate deaminase [subsurface metagenome]